MKSIFAVFLLFFQFTGYNASQADIIDDLAVHFKNNNSKEIAKFFASSVELLVIDQEDVYSKAQSEQILKDFFVKNPSNKVTIVHRLNSNPNYRYGIFSIQSKSSKFRVTVTLTKQRTGNVFLINELRIEKD